MGWKHFVVTEPFGGVWSSPPAHTIGHVNIGIISLCIGNSQRCLYNIQSKSDWLLNTQSRVLQVDWLILENAEKATLNINMPYWLCITQSYFP